MLDEGCKWLQSSRAIDDENIPWFICEAIGDGEVFYENSDGILLMVQELRQRLGEGTDFSDEDGKVCCAVELRPPVKGIFKEELAILIESKIAASYESVPKDSSKSGRLSVKTGEPTQASRHKNCRGRSPRAGHPTPSFFKSTTRSPHFPKQHFRVAKVVNRTSLSVTAEPTRIVTSMRAFLTLSLKGKNLKWRGDQPNVTPPASPPWGTHPKPVLALSAVQLLWSYGVAGGHERSSTTDWTNGSSDLLKRRKVRFKSELESCRKKLGIQVCRAKPHLSEEIRTQYPTANPLPWVLALCGRGSGLSSVVSDWQREYCVLVPPPSSLF
ncbi:hypothetical protein BDK51DRAFT_29882 [Blyttiomyces helicus]|uniref:Uncharacterized protein n=1 Tax=Blyttiomyces helicus TaxID=388810 RepID=A0A4P9WTX9_9FUNG|nr:hypothetical protein BDK51DRAFT_29882 [Blyttiomyces helicus]|eukprot:RKO94830.1 hypothetical protein BDK51DRAFT_29882 [Blyttiomyces helicus]